MSEPDSLSSRRPFHLIRRQRLGTSTPLRLARVELAWPGWAYVIPLPSGWNAAFVDGPSITEGPLREDSPVLFLFKGA
jgi:hypothetical protein